jgi:hypothetical protein
VLVQEREQVPAHRLVAEVVEPVEEGEPRRADGRLGGAPVAEPVARDAASTAWCIETSERNTVSSPSRSAARRAAPPSDPASGDGQARPAGGTSDTPPP